MMVVREQDCLRLITLGPALSADRRSRAEAAAKSFVLEGELVVLDNDGVSDFESFASRNHDKRAQFYPFDMLAGEGGDHRALVLALRKAKLARLLSHSVNGIFIAEYSKVTPATFYSASRAT